MNYSLIHKINHYSKKKVTPILLNDLIKYSQNPDNNQKLLMAKFIYNELPIRLSQRIVDFNNLPYDFLKQNSMTKVYNLYNESFKMLVDFKIPKNIDDVKDYSKLLTIIKNQHSNIIHDIANSLFSYKKFHNIPYKDEFNVNQRLYEFYMSRLSIRFLLSQYLESSNNKNNFIGIINKKCSPVGIVYDCIFNIEKMCYIIYKKYPSIIVNDFLDKKKDIIYLDSHLAYIVTEILKNAVFATMENNIKKPINIDLMLNDDNLIIKISDSALGFKREKINELFNFTFTTANIDKYCDKNVIISGFGHGLGMSRIYARYFGGDIMIIPFEGVGTDVYIYIKQLGKNKENISDLQT